MQHILIIDYFDSFTHNLAHYFEGMECVVDVVREGEPIKLSDYDKLIISPGPGLPEDSEMLKVINEANGKLPVLGVCLGMQGIASYLNGGLVNKTQVKHGVEDIIQVDTASVLFASLNAEITVGLYHSWEVNDDGDYTVDAVSVSDSTVMAISNLERRMYGVQFHPESILTPDGRIILENFLKNG